MIQKQHTQIMINGEPIPPDSIYDVQLYSSIWEILPKLSFKIIDPTGNILANLSITQGSEVRVSIVDVANHNESFVTSGSDSENEKALDIEKLKSLFYVETKPGDFAPTKFIIKEIFNGFEYSSSNPTAGYIQIECVQAWDLYVNSNLDAYRGKISEVIKTVLQNSIKFNGLDLSKIDDLNYFSNSSDSGATIRHGAGLSDLEFVENLLKYLTVQEEPGYFYIDIFGRPRIANFNQMLNKKSEIFAFIYKNLNEGQQSILNQLLEESQASNKIPIENIICEFGQNKNITNLIRYYSTLNIMNYSQMNSGILESDAVLKVKEKDDRKWAIPFNQLQFYSMPSTKFSLSPLWESDYDKGLLRTNAFKSSDNLIAAKIQMNYFSEDVSVGDSLELFSPGPGVNVHWINGRWVIAETNYFVKKDSNGKDIGCVMDMTLIRRAVPLSKNSSIADSAALV